MKYFGIIVGIVLLSVQAVIAQQRPNVVIFIADDVSWNDFGCYGNKEVKTPNIDRIAREGLRFTNVYLTASSCSPSRNSILSGRYPHNTGAAELHTPLPAEVPTFPGALKEAGYHCVSAGKWHSGPHAVKDFSLVQSKGNGNGGEEQWVNVLRDRPREKPFFMWFAALDAHREWGENQYAGTNPPDAISPPPYMANTPATRRDLAQYYDEITRFDTYIGEVEEELARQGVLDNTLIIIMADNGRPFPRNKTRLYDEGIRTPFIVKWKKGIKAQVPQVSESLISVIDIAPTVLELAGLSVLPGFQGKSFSKVLKEPGSSFRNYVFAEHNWHNYEAYERMVRTKDWLYIYNGRPQFASSSASDIHRSPAFQDLVKGYHTGELTKAQQDNFIQPRPAEELYNCAKDPYQLTNLAEQAVHNKELQKLKQVLKNWMDQTGDTQPDHLTPADSDWFSGNKLDTPLVRGEMPGTKRGAVSTTNKGPF
ncbi:sulfatase family protein [Telluribacter humicola]|uniref:sulfatase family protein n=1 Tax=Telluribacter humicola TaxID=1720261 RepID=UPI001A96B52C|nr:sulfatase [Telluribacter humicola]